LKIPDFKIGFIKNQLLKNVKGKIEQKKRNSKKKLGMLGRPNNPSGGCAAPGPHRPGRHTAPPLKCSDRLQIYFRDGRNERKNNKTGPVKQHSRPSETKDEAKSLTT
jgi:hypothetical protein